VRLCRIGNIAAIVPEKCRLTLKIYADSRPQLVLLKSDEKIALLVVTERILRLLQRIAEELERVGKLTNSCEVDMEEFIYKALLTYAAMRLGYIDPVTNPESRSAIMQVLEEAARIAEIRLARG